jgi:hypothetical protein
MGLSKPVIGLIYLLHVSAIYSSHYQVGIGSQKDLKRLPSLLLV